MVVNYERKPYFVPKAVLVAAVFCIAAALCVGSTAVSDDGSSRTVSGGIGFSRIAVNETLWRFV